MPADAPRSRGRFLKRVVLNASRFLRFAAPEHGASRLPWAGIDGGGDLLPGAAFRPGRAAGAAEAAPGTCASAGLLVALWLAWAAEPGVCGAGQSRASFPRSWFSPGMFAYDQYGIFFKLLLLLGTAVSLLLALHSREISGKNQGDFFLLLVAVCAGGMFLASAANLLMIYLSLEFLSIISYALAGSLRRDRKSAEAGIKYVVYGAMSSGIMLFGMSYLYGLTGTLNLLDTAAPGGRRVQGRGFDRFWSWRTVMAPRRAAPWRPSWRCSSPVPLQDRRRAVPLLVAGRVRGRADGGHGVLLGGAEGRGLCGADPRAVRFLPHRPDHARMALLPARGKHRGGAGRPDHGHRQPGGAGAIQRQTHVGLFVHCPRRLHARRACRS